jgi:hypothetical protein
MTRLCCPGCRLRFARATGANLTTCPTCGEPLQALTPAQALGLRLFADDDRFVALPQAVAAMLPVPPTDRRRS